MTIPPLHDENGNLFDYDLNIYRLEEAGLDEDGEEVWEYTDQWYVDIYDYANGQQEHVTGPFPIEAKQRDLLQLGTEGTYFTDDDSWYGMWGFINDYQDKLLPELSDILHALPKYKEEILF